MFNSIITYYFAYNVRFRTAKTLRATKATRDA